MAVLAFLIGLTVNRVLSHLDPKGEIFFSTKAKNTPVLASTRPFIGEETNAEAGGETTRGDDDVGVRGLRRRRRSSALASATVAGALGVLGF